MLTQSKGTKVAVVTELPNTVIKPDLVNPPAIPDDVGLYIYDTLVAPLLRHFRGGTPMGPEEATKHRKELVAALIGFEAPAYGVAVRMMIDERKDPFLPVPAVIKDYLQKAERAHYAAGGQVRRAKRLEIELTAVVGGQPWDTNRLGPAPGSQGCRVTDEQVLVALREALLADRSEADIVDTRLAGITVRFAETATGELDVGPHVMLRRTRRAAKGLGDPWTQGPACRALLVDMGVPVTPEDIAAADAEIATWEADRHIRALRIERGKAAREIDNNARHMRENRVGDQYWTLHSQRRETAQAKLDEIERAIAEMEGQDMVAWDAQRAAQATARAALAASNLQIMQIQ
jgi:hypothetical protein